MPVAFDAVSSNSGANVQSVTISHTVGTGSNRVLIVDGILGDSPDSDNLSATYGGVAMTSIGKRHANDQTAGYIERFVLLNPASGAANVVLSKSGGDNGNAMIVGCVSFANASQTIGDYNFTSAVGEGISASVTEVSSSSDSAVLFGACAGTPMTANTQTSRWAQNVNSNTAAGNGRGASAAGTGSNITCSFTISNTDWWAAIATEIPFASGASSTDGVLGAVGPDADASFIGQNLTSGTLGVVGPDADASFTAEVASTDGVLGAVGPDPDATFVGEVAATEGTLGAVGPGAEALFSASASDASTDGVLAMTGPPAQASLTGINLTDAALVGVGPGPAAAFEGDPARDELRLQPVRLRPDTGKAFRAFPVRWRESA